MSLMDDPGGRMLALADHLDCEALDMDASIEALGGPVEANAYLVGARDAYHAAACSVRNLGAALRLRRA